MRTTVRRIPLIAALVAALATAVLLGPVAGAASAQPGPVPNGPFLPLPPIPLPPPIGEDPPPPPPVPDPEPAPPATGPVLHLTFDDGPDPRWTPQVLDELRRHDATATFFLVGRRAAAYPDLVRRIVAEGHTVANHTYTHPDLTTVSRAEFDRQVDSTQPALGRSGRMCLRPPYGAVNQNVRDWAADRGYRLQLWSVDTQDYRKPGAEVIADRIVNGARDGAVVLMHDAGGTDRSQTVRGLALALDRLEPGDWRYEHTC